MSGGQCSNECMVHYVVTGAMVILWLAATVAFWYLKLRKANGTKQNSIPAQEMIKVSEGKASQPDDGLIYTEVKHNAKSKAKNLPRNAVPEAIYAEVKVLSEKPDDGIKDLYACVNKAKTQT